MIANHKHAMASDGQYVAQNTKQVFHNIQPAESGTYVICKFRDSNEVYLEKVLFWEISIIYDDYCLMPISLNGRISESENIDSCMCLLFSDGHVRSSQLEQASLKHFLESNNFTLCEFDAGIAKLFGGVN